MLPSLINPHISPALSEVILRSLQKDPLARFSSASEMAAALEQALTSAFNEGMAKRDKPQPLPPASLSLGMSSPRFYTPASEGGGLMSPLQVSSTPQSSTPAGANPSLGATPVLSRDASPLQSPDTVAPAFSPLPSGTAGQAQSSPVAPGGTVAASPPPSSPASTPPVPMSAPPLLKRKGLLVGLLLLLTLILGVSGLGAFYLLPQTHQATLATTNQVVGHAYFGSSGQLNEHTTQGLDDTLRLNLSNISPTAAGKAYYLWALSDVSQNPPTSLLLGRLVITSGKVDFFYPGDSQHSDLFGTYSRLLINEEGATRAPLHPSSDRSTWRYYAELPQTSRPSDNQSAIEDLRTILYRPINELGILPDEGYGGFFTPFLQNTRTITQLADSARDSWSKKHIPTLRNQIIQILDYLDGAGDALQDVPPNTPLLVNSRIPLITQNQSQEPRSYLDHIGDRLSDLIATPGISPEMNKLATQAHLALLNNVQPWLNQARLDAAQLATITDAELLLPSTGATVSDLQTQLHNAYSGQLDPTSRKVQQEGEQQIFNDVHNLINFDIKPYLSSTGEELEARLV